MRKLIVPLLVIGLAVVAIRPASAGVTFEVENGFNLFSDDRVEGQNRHVGMNFDLNDSVEVGVYVERAELQLNGDVGATPPNFTKIEFDAQAIRINKKFKKWLTGGIDIGSAKLQQGAFTGFAATAALNQNKPFVGLHGAVHHSVEIKDKVTTSFKLSLGYRFLDLNDVVLAGAPVGESTLDDLNALIIGVGFGIGF